MRFPTIAEMSEYLTARGIDPKLNSVQFGGHSRKRAGRLVIMPDVFYFFAADGYEGEWYRSEYAALKSKIESL